MAARVPVAESSMRPNVLAYPSPTTARYLIFVGALICTGLFVGNWVHNDVRGEQWRDTIVACGLPDLPNAVSLDDFGSEGSATIEQQRVTACTRDAERTRAAFVFGGAGLVVVMSLTLFLLAPRLVERRRRLRALGPKLSGAQERFDQLADAAEVTGRVRARIGPARQRDAFSYGIPLHSRVALPPAVAARWRDSETFDAVVTHELAHVSRRDVSLAWLVRSIGYVIIPILLIPALVGLIEGDLALVLDYSWRVVLLAVVVVLLSNGLLRSREYDADIHAARQLGAPDQLVALLGRTPTRLPGRFGWLRARHPTPPQRVEVVTHPERVTTVHFEDGLTSGFLTALAVPLLVSSLSTLLATFDRIGGATVISAALVGPILGAAVGLALWRAAVMTRLVVGTVPVVAVALGVGLGFAAGQVVTLADTGVEEFSALHHPSTLLISGLAGAGATVVSASIGELWADVVPGVRDARHGWLIGLAVNALLFSSVLWAANHFAFAIDIGGWDVGRWVLISGMSSWWMFVVVGLLATAVAVPIGWRPRQRLAPSWLIEDGSSPTWPRMDGSALLRVAATGIGSGLVAAGWIVAYRIWSGAASGLDEQWERYWTYAWVSAGAAVAAALICQVLLGRRGAACGLVAGVVASLTASTGYLLYNASLGGGWDPAFVGDFVRSAVVLGFYGTLLVSVAALLFERSLVAGSVRRSRAVGIAVVTSILVPGLLLSARALVVPPLELQVFTDFVQPDEGTDDDSAVYADLREYLVEVVPDAESRYLTALSTAARVEAGDFAGVEVGVLESQVQQPLQQLWDDMTSYEPSTREVATVHANLLVAIEHTVRGMAFLVAAYQVGEKAALGPALTEFDEAARLWGEWQAAREELAAQVLER